MSQRKYRKRQDSDEELNQPVTLKEKEASSTEHQEEHEQGYFIHYIHSNQDLMCLTL